MAREPVPNPENASDLAVTFVDNDDSTTLDFKHFNFENHGEGSGEYQRMMNSEQGWENILNRFKSYCEN